MDIDCAIALERRLDCQEGHYLTKRDAKKKKDMRIMDMKSNPLETTAM